jgi:hypothetical protein
MTRILCVGDIMLDVTAMTSGHISQALETRAVISTQGGGAAANVASWLAKEGTATFLIARVGDDAAGRVVLSELDQYGVSHSNLVIAGAKTGVVIVLVDPLGERTMFPDSGANSGLTVADLPPLEEFTAAYFSGYAFVNPQSREGALQILKEVRAKGIPIFFDPSTVGVLMGVGLAQIRDWLTLVDVVILNEEEAQFITGFANVIEAAEDLLVLTPTVVIKRGAIGALAAGRDVAVVQVPSVSTIVIDTTGAGDAFAAGFIRAWSHEMALVDALKAGARLGAQCVALVGSRPPFTDA